MRNPKRNPLYFASDIEHVNADLLTAPDNICNSTQLKVLNQNHPFYLLQKRRDDPPMPQPTKNSLSIHVFAGTHDHHNHQFTAFVHVMSYFKNQYNLKVIYLTHKQVRNKSWTFENIIDWLSSGSLHFILCHMHQGVKLSLTIHLTSSAQ